MIVYIYDNITGEYKGQKEAFLDPMASKRLGKEVYLQPANGTFIEPPKVNKPKNEVAIFKNGEWIVEHDYRGKEIYNVKTGEVSVCDTIGDLEGEQFTTKKELPIDLSVKPYLEDALNRCINVYGLSFKPVNTENLVKLIEEHTVSTDKIISRDDLNNPYIKTITEIKKVVRYLSTYKQLAYIKKWKKEKELEQQPTDKLKEMCLRNFRIEVSDEEIDTFMNYSKEQKTAYLEDVYNLISR